MGLPGLSGSSGSSGIGAAGSGGSAGTSGSSGATGGSGSSGTSGTAGSSGTSGTRGSSGSSGTSGANGATGSSGTSGTGFTTISSAANNRVLTSDGSANAAVAETNLTFDGTILSILAGGYFDMYRPDSAAYAHIDVRTSGNNAIPHKYTYNISTSTYQPYTEYWWDSDSYHSLGVSSNQFYIDGSVVWNAGNDGAGSTLDADLLDGQHGTYYAAASSLSSYALTNQTMHIGTTAVAINRGSGALSLTGVSIDGNAGTVESLTINQIFNNRGRNHGDPTDFNSVSVFGPYFIQGTTNGPGTGAGQFYGISLGLGNEYAYSSYALQLAIPRYGYNASSDRYISIRNRENGTWGAWSKIYAGYADSAGGLTGYSGTFWTSNNDGAGSGLDADLLDGSHGSDYVNVSGTQTISGAKTFTNQTVMNNGTSNALYIDTTVADGNTRDAIYLYENDGQASGRQAISWYNGNNNYYKARLWTQVGSGYNNTLFGIDVADNSRSVSTRMTIDNGSAFFTGNVTAYSSDIRLKTGIERIDNALDKVMKLNGVIYSWKHNVEKLGFTPQKQREAGLLAQEVQSVVPELVSLAPFDRENGLSKSGENYLTVHYERVVALLVEAIKELNKKIETLEGEKTK